MLKKIILGTVFVGLIAFLVAGAINRTQDKTEDSVEAAGLGRGQQRTDNNVEAHQPGADYQLTGGQGNRGGGQSTAEYERQYPNYQEPIDEWLTISGTVTQVPAEGVDLVMETADGELVVGTGPSAMVEQGFDVQIGDELEVMGYWEDDELKAAEITLLATDQTIVLRDEWGRPVWSGSVRTGRGAQAELIQTGGRGSASADAVGQTAGRGGSGRNGTEGEITQGSGQAGSGRNGTEGEITQGSGQAEVNEWIMLQGVVTSIDESALIMQLNSGELVTVENRPWWFAQEQGFSAEVGDEIELAGFYEGENFETGQFTNLTSSLVIDIRQESGRPLWAGGGRNG
jgi:hypothetical protein